METFLWPPGAHRTCIAINESPQAYEVAETCTTRGLTNLYCEIPRGLGRQPLAALQPSRQN